MNCTRIIQLSDIHLFANSSQKLLGINTRENLKLIIEKIQNDTFVPDFIILSGDLSQDQSEKSYQALLSLMKVLPYPIYWVAGNHDNLLTMTKVFAGKLQPEKAILTANQWLIILLNSAKPGNVVGFLNPEEMQYLKNNLHRSDYQYALIVMHHQPWLIDSAWIDSLGLENAREFFQIVETSHQIKAIASGHVHQDFSTEKNNIKFLSAPATSIQFLPKSQNFAVDEKQPPGYRCLELYDDGTIKSWVNRLEHYEAVYDLHAKGY